MTDKEAENKVAACYKKFTDLADEFQKRGYNIMMQMTIHLPSDKRDCVSSGIHCAMAVEPSVAMTMLKDHTQSTNQLTMSIFSEMGGGGPIEPMESAGDA